MKEKIILAYSGGLDTSVAIKWLQEKYGYDVIAVAVDVGEGKELEPVKQKALNIGASKAYVIDAKKEFAENYLMPALQANALYEGIYPLISSLSRPLIAKILVEIAQQEKAVAVAHGCTGKGNDQVRFDVSIKALNPSLKIIAPQREFPMTRDDAITYAKANHIPVPVTLDSPFSIDKNLWGRSCECGVLEDPWQSAPDEAYDLTLPLEKTPNTAEEITIHFSKGIPTALNNQAMPLVDLISQLNVIAGKHGVGQIDHVENRLVGIKSREIYEAPAAMTLIKAHSALESLTLTRDSAHFKPIVEQRFANLVYEGMWYSPLNEALQAFIKATQESVTGIVKVKLYKGQAVVTGRQSPASLYQYHLATYEKNDQFDHKAAEGFVKLWGLPLEVLSLVNMQQEKDYETVGG